MERLLKLFVPVLLILMGWGAVTPAFSGFNRRHFSQYGRWSLEMNAGVPFVIGTLSSFSEHKLYIGLAADLGAGYQISPVWGVRLSGGYGRSRIGARAYAGDYLLGEDGMTYYLEMPFRTWHYRDIYTEVSYLSAGLHADVNLFNLLGGEAAGKWCTVLFSPALYVQRFSPEVRTLADDAVIFSPSPRLCAGFGGDVTVRFRMTALFDLQLRSGARWISDNRFVGFGTPVLARYNYIWNTSVGLVFKIPQRGRREHMMYMPRRGECYLRF